MPTPTAPIKMTRAEYQAKYGAPPPVPTTTTPIKMTRAEYDAKYNTTPPAPSDPLGSVHISGSQAQNNPGVIKDSFFGGLQRAKQGFQQSNTAKNPLELGEGALKMGSGAFGAVFSPLSPLFAPIGKIAGDIGNKISESKGLQEFARTPTPNEKAAGKKDFAAPIMRATEDVSDLTNIAGSVAGFKSGAGIKAKAPSIPDVASIPGKIKGAFESSPETVITKRKAELQRVIDGNAVLRKVTAKHAKDNIDTADILSRTDLLHNAVDNTGTIRTQDAIHELNDFIKPQEDVISSVLEREGRALHKGQIEKALKTAIDESSLEGEALDAAHRKVQAEMSGLSRRADPNGVITLSKVHDAKVNKYSTIDYLNPSSKAADKIIARTYKKLVEDNTTSADVIALNKELKSHFSVLDLLEKLDGRKVEGGRLGKYFAKTVGAVVGSHFGPLGAIAGAELAGRAKGFSLSRKLSGKTGGALQQSPAMQKAVAGKDAPVALLPEKTQSSNSLGNLNLHQSPTKTIVPIKPNTAITDNIPQEARKAIDNHLTSAEQVYTSLTEKGTQPSTKTIAALMDRTKTNIADGLHAQGFKAIAEHVRNFDLTPFSDFQTFKTAILEYLKNIQPGLSMKRVNPLDNFKGPQKDTLMRTAKAIDAGGTVPQGQIDLMARILKEKGLQVPPTPKQAARMILDAVDVGEERSFFGNLNKQVGKPAPAPPKNWKPPERPAYKPQGTGTITVKPVRRLPKGKPGGGRYTRYI